MSGLPRSSHALVTGGGRGIGREIAATLARAGATVTVLGRNRATLDEAIASGAAHFAGVADVVDQAAVSAAIAEAAARQPIDMLIANAGIAESAPFGKSDAAFWRMMMPTHGRGLPIDALPRETVRIISRLYLPLVQGLCLCQRLQRRKTRRCWLSPPLALELASTGGRQCVCPGFTDTDPAGSVDNIMKKTTQP
jgi:NAD(P)-dependent dehydrogenase (short-subunit alcohol dehydrogenase family)